MHALERAGTRPDHRPPSPGRTRVSIGAITRRTLRAAAALAGTLALAACATVDNFGDRGLAYNEQITSTQNRMLFLNIVRAAHKHPMAFTSIGSVAGTATASGALGFTLPFADNPGLIPFQAGPQLSASGGPTFTINNLDGQDFMKGFLTPVDVKTIDLFGQEGLPWQELYDLFISKVAITDSYGHPRAWLHNSPGEWASQVADEAQFQEFLEVLRRAQMHTEAIQDFIRIGPEVSGKDAPTLDAAIAATQANLVLAAVGPGRYQLGRTVTDHRFCIGNPAATVLMIRAAGQDYPMDVTPGMRCGATAAERAGASPSSDDAGATHKLFASAAKGGYQLIVSLRSAEAVTYYLGEVLRQQLCLDANGRCGDFASRLVMVRSDVHDDAPTPLFVAALRAPRPRDLVAVRYMGQTICVAGDEANRSAQVLTVLGQLLNLNKSAKDNPAPNIVTLVGH
jgi:hypothetical protein